MNQGVTDKICNMKIVPLKESNYLHPLRAEFEINGRKKYWDFETVHDSVSILIYNTSRKVLVFVRQFRPSLYLAQVPNKKEGMVIDTEKYDLSQGYSLELCAGIVDKDSNIDEIARDEVLEECGYDVPVSSLQKLFSVRGVGITGQMQTLYYVEVTDSQKVSSGGGLKEEGEFIEVIELTVPEVKKYLDSKNILSPAGFLAAIQWFLQNCTFSKSANSWGSTLSQVNPSSIYNNEDPNVIDILLAAKCRYPSFTEAKLRSILSLTTSIDAERFFIKYNIVITDRRTTLKETKC